MPAGLVGPHRLPEGPWAVMPAYERYAKLDVNVVPEISIVEVVRDCMAGSKRTVESADKSVRGSHYIRVEVTDSCHRSFPS